MRVARQLAALLGFSALLVLLTCSPARKQSQPAPPDIAQAQGAATPARIDLYLPPAHTLAPNAQPLPVARRPSRSRSRAAAPARSGLRPSLQRGKSPGKPHPACPARRPGLFTVARVGRLLYRKGYLGDIPIHLVVADMGDPDVKLGVLVASAGVGSTESFASMMHRAQPAAAITGTFFGVHNRLPTGDLVVNGHAIYQGFVGTAIAFTEGNLVSFIRTGYKQKTAWRFFDGVVRAGPMLVQAGQIVVAPRREGFVSLSPAARRPRTAVGITAGAKLLLLAVKEPISLWRLAKLMRALGAYHAVAMDGGTSTGLYFRGRMIAQPGRALTNVLTIYADRQHYQQAKGAFSDGVPPSMVQSVPRPPGPALLIRVLPAGESQSRPAPESQEAAVAPAALPAAATAPLASPAPASAGTAPPAIAESQPAHALASPSPRSSRSSGPVGPTLPEKSTPSTSETTRAPTPGAG